MDLGTIAGILIGVVLLGLAMAMGDGGLILFFSPNSFFIVIGGTLGATAIAFPTKEMKDIIPFTMRVFRNPTLEVEGIAEGKPVRATFAHADGTSDVVELKHSLSEEQIEWFRAGSALNMSRVACQ